ncbi:MAG: SLBB domain-containing protein [Planctomycetes bacterium]|nr:SLBB domain-containing protein [Planctomycetota bacterium]
MLLAVCSANARAQVPGSNVKVINVPSAGASSELYVGILGEILKPGVYRLDRPSLTLQSVIRRAGGLTDDCSGTIRIVRQDRLVESLFFNPQSNTQLMAGDLLVVESRRAQSAISKLYESDPNLRSTYARAAAEAVKSADPAGVQVAFLNVLDRPVVVKVKHEDARLSNVLQMLDQPLELAESVRVIGPDRLLLQGNATHPIQAPLADGSVIVFPRNAINRKSLPALPAPFDSEIASGAFPSLIGGPSGQSAELRNVGQLPPRVARETLVQPPANLDQATAPAPTSIQSIVPPPMTERLEIPAPVQTQQASSRPPIATLPSFKGGSRITSSSQVTRTTDPDRSGEPPAIDQMSRTPAESGEFHSRSSIDTSLDSNEPDATTVAEPNVASHHDGKKAPISLLQIVSVLAGMGLLIGVALFTRHYLERRAVRSAIQNSQIAQALPQAPLTNEQSQMSATKRDQGHVESTVERSSATLWFDQLLGNQLTIREEPLEFPSQIALQGRIVPAPVYRLDTAASHPPTPHFTIRQPGEVEQAASLPESEPEVIDEFEDAHSSRPSRPHFLRRAGEKTVAAAAVMASQAASPPVVAEFKPSSTPVTDALRHLQGGQP